MRAALLVEPRRIVLNDLASPTPGPDEVRIDVVGVGLCGSDLSVFRGAWDVPTYPWIMGHEAFGTIEAVGQAVPSTRLGETVVIEPNAICGTCEPCRRGRTSACKQRQSMGMNRPGSLAEQVVVPTQHAWRVSTGTAEDLVCVEPLTVVETALRRLRAPVPASVLVVGVGAQGSLMCLVLRRRGADVVVADVNPDRTAFAVGLGAMALEDADTERRFDLVVDTAGTPPAVELALARAEVGGTIVELSLDGRPFELTAQSLVRRQLTLQGSLTYDHPQDFADAVSRFEDGSVRPGRIVTDEFSLDSAQRAFERAATAPGKTWIRISPALSPGRGSGHGGAQTEQVAVDAEPGDATIGDV